MIYLNNRKLYIATLTIIFSASLAGCKKTIDARQLENINGLYYKINEHDPFTGTVINNLKVDDYTSYYASNCTIEFKNGEMDGAFICHSLKDEIKVADMRYKNNLKHGTQRGWDKQNGALKWKIEWNNGKHHGVEEQYNPLNGKLIEEINWDNNQKVGIERKWNLNGDVLLEDLYWVDGKQTGYSISTDRERNYKNGKLDGINRRFALIDADSDSDSEYQNLDSDVKARNAGRSSYMLVPHYVSLEENYQNGELISSVTKYKDKEHQQEQELKVQQVEIERLEELEEREKQRKLNENMPY